MGAAKRAKLNPRELASKVVEGLAQNDYAEKLDVAGPGFINITLKDSFLSKTLTETPLVQTTDSPQTIVVDYSSPNLAKEMHIGHLRSTIIGDAVARTLELAGHRVVRQNHIGDWGTAFGRLLAYLDTLPKTFLSKETDQLSDLEQLYVEASRKFEEDSDFAEASRIMVLALQRGDAAALTKWEKFLAASMAHMHEIYTRLGVSLRASDIRGESSYNADLPVLIDELRAQQGLLVESDGALCIFMDEFRTKDGDIQPMLVRKSDGGYLYHTTDLAALRYRNDTLQADRILYFTDARQSLHFRMLFAAARLAGIVRDNTKLEHHPFGSILGTDGKPFKSRSGENVHLGELLDEALHRAARLIDEKGTVNSPSERAAVTDAVGIGAVKYADLSKNSRNDYVFDWDEMLSFEGNTAPYLQYAYARIVAVFERVGIDLTTMAGQLAVGTEAEHVLAVQLLRFQETIDSVVEDAKPHYLCSYLYDLAVRFMRFYESCPILKAEDDVRTSRLMLCKRTAETLETGLDTLGIRVVTRM